MKFVYLSVVTFFALMILMLTPIPKMLTQKAVAMFSLHKVYVASTVVAVLSFSLIGFTTLAYAQDMSTDGGLIQYVLQNVLVWKTLGPVGIALFISKAILAAFNTPTFGKLLDKLTGKMKLVVTLSFTYVVGVLTIMVANKVPLAVALFDSANIPLLGLLLNQIYKQFVVKASEPSKAVQAASSLR